MISHLSIDCSKRLAVVTAAWFCLGYGVFHSIVQASLGEISESNRVDDDDIPKHKARKWKDKTGKHEVLAKIVAYDRRRISLQKESDGTTITLEVAQLSELDRSYLKVLFDELGIPDKSETSTPPKLENAKNKKDSSPPEKPAKKKYVPKKRVDKKYVPKSRIAKKPAAKPVKNIPPNPNCEKCMGIGLVPLKSLVFKVQKEGAKSGLESEPLGACCPACQKGQDPLKHSDDSDALVSELDDFHKEVEKGIGKSLKRYETRYRVVHSELSDRESTAVLKAINSMESRLQKMFGHLLLSNSRRGEDDVILINQRTFPKAVELVKNDLVSFQADWNHMLTLHAFSIDRYSAAMRSPQTPRTIINKTVFTLATKQLGKAAFWNEPPWLYSGFGAVMEYEVLKMNIVYVSAPAEYQSAQPKSDARSDPKFASNWNSIFRRMARAGKARSWDAMFDLQVNDYQLIHDLQAKSMVNFLVTKPEKFTSFLNNLSQMENKRQALADAYEIPMEDLEKEWKKWVGFK